MLGNIKQSIFFDTRHSCIALLKSQTRPCQEACGNCSLPLSVGWIVASWAQHIIIIICWLWLLLIFCKSPARILDYWWWQRKVYKNQSQGLWRLDFSLPDSKLAENRLFTQITEEKVDFGGESGGLSWWKGHLSKGGTGEGLYNLSTESCKAWQHLNPFKPWFLLIP